MINALLKTHWLTLSTVSSTVWYVLGDYGWLDSYMPIQGEPLVVTIFIGTILATEVALKKHKQISDRFDEVSELIRETAKAHEVGTIRHRVNSIYQAFLDSKDEHITNDFTVRQLADLQDKMTSCGINSYSQGQMEYLRSKIMVNRRTDNVNVNEDRRS